MIVYRVEHEEVKDPRTGGFAGPMSTSAFAEKPFEFRERFYNAQNSVCRVMNNGDHPTPYADRLLNVILPTEVCGVDSPDAVAYWFGAALWELLLVGFTVRKYEVPDCSARRGEHGQILFQLAAAKRVDEEKSSE